MKKYIKSATNTTTLYDVLDNLKRTADSIEQLPEDTYEILEQITSHVFYDDILDAIRYISSELNIH